MGQAVVEKGSDRWTNPSVRPLLAESTDAVAAIIHRARTLVLRAISDGWSGPPFDPAALAELVGIGVRPRADIDDARIVPVGDRHLVIEFNPNRPAARIRYSIAHEIGHTLFDDCADDVRNRSKKTEIQGDDWELEMLCNVAAAEILMPFGSLPELDASALTIERVAELRRQYQVSTEAILLRAVKLSRQSICAFAASRIERGSNGDRYRVDYAVPALGWKLSVTPGMLLPKDTIVKDCTAIGFTAKGSENWPNVEGKVQVECVGVQPYEDRLYPRVLGFVRRSRAKNVTVPEITYVTGDATQPRGDGIRLLVHIVNDKTPNWGAGFAAVVKRKWPIVQEDFQHWAREGTDNLRLGNLHVTRLETNLFVGHMISQHGYGQTVKPGIRYDALARCLDSVGEFACAHGASVHMPRIGTGQARGSWTLVKELIEQSLCRRGLPVTVYDLRGANHGREEPASLFSYA